MFVEINQKLTATFEFNDFVEAFSFMTTIAFWAEQMNHHPNWSNIYNQVKIELTTHDANNTVTQKDWLLAQKIEKLYQRTLALRD